MPNRSGLALSQFQADVLANLPPLFPEPAFNIAFFYATDTDTLYVAKNPGPPATFGGPQLAATWIALSGGGGSSYVAVPDAATYAVLTTDSGKIHVLPDFTASCTITLPLPTKGLRYTFIPGANAADAQNWVITAPAGGSLMKGGVVALDTDAGAGADEISTIHPNGSSHVKITVNTPDAGTDLRLIADGTNWLISGTVSSTAAPAFS